MTRELEDRTSRVVGAAIEVHRALGPFFLETVYESALAVEFTRRGILFVRQLRVPIHFRGGTTADACRLPGFLGSRVQKPAWRQASEFYGAEDQEGAEGGFTAGGAGPVHDHRAR